jgi:tetratricopeptide (TPR) repeat protein
LLGDVVEKLGEYEQSEAIYDRAIGLAVEIHDRQFEAGVIRSLGELKLACGDMRSAQSLIQESLDIYRDLDDPPRAAVALIAGARVARLQGRLSAAESMMTESFDIIGRVGHKTLMAESLEEMGYLICAMGHPSKAACLWASAQAIRDAFRAKRPPKAQDEHDRQMDQARGMLGAEEFGRAVADCALLDWHDAIASLQGASLR